MMKLFLTTTVILFTTNLFAAEFSFDKFDYNFQWNRDRLVNRDVISLQYDAGIDHKIAKITWNTGDNAHGWRAELADEYLAPNEVPLYYSFWFKIPKDYALKEGDSCVLMQFHTPDSDHKPQIAFRTRGNGRLDITLNHIDAKDHEEARRLQKKPVKIENFQRDQWHLVEMYIKWSAKKGFININIDGKRQLTYRGVSNYASQASGPYFKYGVYPAKNLPYSLSAKFGKYRRLKRPKKEFIKNKKLN